MEVIELSCMTLVDSPGFTGIEESGENNSIVYFELGV